MTSDLATNGQEAIDKVIINDSYNPYDIILMDCNMPIKDGFEASTHIRLLFKE